MADTYKIVRHYFGGGKVVIRTGLTLEQAQVHCNHPETSSTTATTEHAKSITRERGPWFDGYYREEG